MDDGADPVRFMTFSCPVLGGLTVWRQLVCKGLVGELFQTWVPPGFSLAESDTERGAACREGDDEEEAELAWTWLIAERGGEQIEEL